MGLRQYIFQAVYLKLQLSEATNFLHFLYAKTHLIGNIIKNGLKDYFSYTKCLLSVIAAGGVDENFLKNQF